MWITFTRKKERWLWWTDCHPAGWSHEEAAKQFLEFTISRDVQEILVSDLNRRSVRRDVAPLEGLVPMAKLPIISAGLKELSSEKEEALTEWKQVMEGGGS